MSRKLIQAVPALQWLSRLNRRVGSLSRFGGVVPNIGLGLGNRLRVGF